jgi:hypothetical protein
MPIGYEEMYLDMFYSFFAAYSVVISIIGILTIVAWWKIFEKAGEAGWIALIPVYREVTMFKITYGSGWKFLLTLIPCAGFVFWMIMYFKLAKSFGQETGFGFGLVFLNTIFVLILGFGNAEYIGAQES